MHAAVASLWEEAGPRSYIFVAYRPLLVFIPFANSRKTNDATITVIELISRSFNHFVELRELNYFNDP